MELEIVDLRTKQNVLDYMNEYDGDIQVITEEDGYEEESYVPYQETDLSKKEIVDMLFEASEEPKYIKHVWYTDFGDTREMLLKVGAVSYFEYERCYDEPDYPYPIEITKEEFYRIMSAKKNEIEHIEREYIETI